MLKTLRATPHAVSLAAHDDSQARVWYGRMILPPKDAYSPGTDATYGDVRNHLIDTPDAEVPSGFGCSSVGMRALSGGGGKDSCEANELMCWSRCMPLADFNINENTCADQGLRLQCINPRDQFSDGSNHGDYYPACTNTTQEKTPYPAITGQPDTCAGEWEAFHIDSTYDHQFNLTTSSNSGAMFMWSVVDEKIKARLSFNNVFGYLSVGLADVYGKKNGMHGANVVMAIPGGDYSAITGLDLNEAASVKSFVIDPTGSSFRHWQKPVGSAPNAEVVSTGCFTTLLFETDQINGIALNTTGTNQMIWGGNGADHYMGYHGRDRARFTVEWSTGEAYFGALKADADSDADADDNTVSSSSRIECVFLTAYIAIASVVYSLYN